MRVKAVLISKGFNIKTGQSILVLINAQIVRHLLRRILVVVICNAKFVTIDGVGPVDYRLSIGHTNLQI